MRTTIRALLVLIALVPVTAFAARTPAEVYTAACANCHGAEGRGHPVDVVGFTTPVPDFTDCSFVSREPTADWLAIAHEGGPVRAFHRMMPAFGEALSKEELLLALEHVRSFCPDRSWPRGDLNFPRPLVTEKAFPEDEAVWSSTVDWEGDSSIKNKFIYEQRFGSRNQFELILPVAFQERSRLGADASWKGGVGDVAVAVKRVLAHSIARGSIFSASAEVILPTGDEDEGFGNATTVAEPFLTFGQRLPRNSFVQSQLGAELPFDSDFEDEGFWRVAYGRSFKQGGFGRTWSPMLEILVAQELRRGAHVSWDAIPQMQFSISPRQHLLGNVGVRLPLDDRDTDTQIIFYVLWDWFDGGLSDGW